MVCEYGMSRLGPLTFGKKEEQIFLGRELSQHRDYSEETAREIDAEVRRFIDTAYKTAFEMLDTNRDVLENIAQALLDREVLDANELQLIIAGKPLPDRTKPPSDSGNSVQQVLRPEPNRQPGLNPGERPSPA